MRGFKYLVLISLWFGLSRPACAQDKKGQPFTGIIKGRVTDHNNKALAGVNVEVQEANRRTVTAPDGSFAIKAAAGDILIFSKKEYSSLQKEVADGGLQTITLEANKIAGDEEDDFIIPFGTRKKRELTYAVSQLDAAALPQLPTSNVLALLGGRIAGLYVKQTGTGPGNETVRLQLRGRSTYNTGNTPAILVDGIPRDATELDVNEIQTVTVLKDAAALTWYGLNAANGVILITTKRGSSKRMSLNFTTEGGVQHRTNNISPLNSFDYATLYNETHPATYDQAALDAYKNGSDPYHFPNNNYIDQFLKVNAPTQRHVLSIDGGNSSFKYFTMLSFVKQDGFFNSSQTPDFNSNAKFQRINFRVNLDYDVNKSLQVGLYATARTNSQREPYDGANGLLNDLYQLPPNAFSILNADGSYGGTSLYKNNPLGRLQERGYVRNLNRVLNVNVNAKQKINFIPGLSANVLLSFDAQGNYTSGLSKDYEVFDMTGATPVKYRTASPLNYVRANFNNNNRHNEVWAGLDYDRQISSIHKLNASVRFMRSTDASPDRLDYRGQQASGRVDYSLMDRYFVGLVGSYSGSENFPPGKRYGFFPAVSAGWILSEENFIKPALGDNYIKLRASYGIMGNGEIGGMRLPYRNAFRAPAGFGYAFGTSFGATVSTDQSITGNPNITWETLKRLNVGSDFILFKRALSFSIDYFNDERSNILTPPVVPSIFGIAQTSVNAGVVTSKGFDASLNWDKQLGQLAFDFNANYTYAKNKVVFVNEDLLLATYQKSIGLNTGNVGGANTKTFFISQGIFQSQAEADAAPKQFGINRSAGDIRYKDVNSDGVIDNLDAVATNYSDIPHTYYGFGLNIKYKAFQISGQLQGTVGRTIDIRSVVYDGPDNLNALSFNRWTFATATTAKYPRLTAANLGNNEINSDFWLRSGDFLKLRTVELSVLLPTNIIQKIKIAKAQLFFAGYNLVNFQKLDIAVDSEMPSAGYGASYPYIKSFAAGLHIQF